MKQPLGSSAVVAALVGSLAAQAHGPGPEYVPIARLIQNLNAAIQKNPKDAESHYLLGRVHYFAFVAPEKAKDTWRQKPDALSVHKHKDSFSFYSSFGSDDPGRNKAVGPDGYARTPEQQVAHVWDAVANLNQALVLRDVKPQRKPRDSDFYNTVLGLYELCFACALEDGARYAPQLGVLLGLPATPEAWREEALRYYWLAYQQAVGEDIKGNRRSKGKLVSEEAAMSYRRLVEVRGTANDGEKERLAQLIPVLAKFKTFPTYVTPIVFSLKPQAGLSSLLAPSKRVRFDLDGTGREQKLSWVGPETAVLCWDPAGTGKITSGKQLFGSVTWWMFWRDGYAAMAALDDNHDGWLTGRELSGLALWFDRNQNGVSDPGEVVPIAQTPVSGLATKATGTEQHGPMNPAGLRLRDGSTLPTWDWVVNIPRP